MALYLTIIGLGTATGIFFNFITKRRPLVCKIIGSLVVLFAGIFAYILVVNPFIFYSFSDLILYTILVALLLAALYVTA